eukprot:GHVP01049968.1.p1 GENE.GHVP01049968.1~~GHVP01049968.1.p1  ORF type:complete len:497 (-),score=98.54 GHVP01049968.1:190-1680(-)
MKKPFESRGISFSDSDQEIGIEDLRIESIELDNKKFFYDNGIDCSDKEDTSIERKGSKQACNIYNDNSAYFSNNENSNSSIEELRKGYNIYYYNSVNFSDSENSNIEEKGTELSNIIHNENIVDFSENEETQNTEEKESKPADNDASIDFSENEEIPEIDNKNGDVYSINNIDFSEDEGECRSTEGGFNDIGMNHSVDREFLNPNTVNNGISHSVTKGFIDEDTVNSGIDNSFDTECLDGGNRGTTSMDNSINIGSLNDGSQTGIDSELNQLEFLNDGNKTSIDCEPNQLKFSYNNKTGIEKTSNQPERELDTRGWIVFEPEFVPFEHTIKKEKNSHLVQQGTRLREWNSRNGKFNVKGVFLKMKEDLVCIRTNTGKKIQTQLTKLSIEDQAYLTKYSNQYLLDKEETRWLKFLIKTGIDKVSSLNYAREMAKGEILLSNIEKVTVSLLRQKGFIEDDIDLLKLYFNRRNINAIQKETEKKNIKVIEERIKQLSKK